MVNSRSLLSVFFAAVLFGGLVLSTMPFSTVKASTDVNGLISSDTTWNKAGSPYSLTGPVGVIEGVTLVIEAGTIVNLNGYIIYVNGTLYARGSDTDKIYFNGGVVSFELLSTGWNEATNSGSIIENAVCDDEVGVMGSQKITKSTLNEIWVYDGDSTISYNTIGRLIVRQGSPSISHNDISGEFEVEDGEPSINGNTIHKGLAVSNALVISNNEISGGISAYLNGGQITISNNELTQSGDSAAIYMTGGHAEIYGNKIMGVGRQPAGIYIYDFSGGAYYEWYPTSAVISGNNIYGCARGIVTTTDDVQIIKNAIFDNEIGLNLWDGAIVQDNTITQNTVGIQRDPSTALLTITNNNIENNTQYNFRLKAQSDVTVADNWWGTTDTEAINQTIFDSKNDFTVGTVTFTPFLTAPNSEAPETSTEMPTYTPTSSPTASPTPTPATTPTPPNDEPTVPSTQEPALTQEQITAITGAAIVVAVIGVGLGLLIYLVKRK